MRIHGQTECSLDWILLLFGFADGDCGPKLLDLQWQETNATYRPQTYECKAVFLHINIFYIYIYIYRLYIYVYYRYINICIYVCMCVWQAYDTSPLDNQVSWIQTSKYKT